MDVLAAVVAIVALIFALKMRRRMTDLELRIAEFTGIRPAAPQTMPEAPPAAPEPFGQLPISAPALVAREPIAGTRPAVRETQKMPAPANGCRTPASARAATRRVPSLRLPRKTVAVPTPCPVPDRVTVLFTAG